MHGIVQISMDALKLCGPRGERVGLIIADHVPHGDSEQVQIILNAQQLQRVLAITVDQFRLKSAQPGHLPCDVRRIGQDGS